MRPKYRPIVGQLVIVTLLLAACAPAFQPVVDGSPTEDAVEPTTDPASPPATATPEKAPSEGPAITEITTVAEDPPPYTPTPNKRSYEIVMLLPPDAIPAIDSPRFYPVEEADAEYAPDELVLGVTINGESKAYSTSHLDSHEIVNDSLGGRAIAVTW